jgi:acetolactate synthase-1/2/3 large subunit
MSKIRMNASDLFIKAIENEGVEIIYDIPGEDRLDFLESLRKSNIKLILTRHEQGAAFMAATYGWLTGKTGVCIYTLGLVVQQTLSHQELMLNLEIFY